jgi:hypothetical protein
MITSEASEKIKVFNRFGLHYNLVADAVYRYRASLSDPFCASYLPYIIAALVSFDMGRMMGPDARSRYDAASGGFATLLKKKLEVVRPYITHLAETGIDNLSLSSEGGNIRSAYAALSSDGKEGLNQRGGEFHVGASKILHFLYPWTFIIVDSNAARAFRQFHQVSFRNTTQPGYSSDKYIECMRCAKTDIIKYGVDKFSSLEEGIPLARIYDKLTFMTGVGIALTTA